MTDGYLEGEKVPIVLSTAAPMDTVEERVVTRRIREKARGEGIRRRPADGWDRLSPEAHLSHLRHEY